MAKTSKYDLVLPGLPVLQPADSAWQAKVQQFKDEVSDRKAMSLATSYVALRAAKEEINKQLSDINLKIEAYEQLLDTSQSTKAEGWGKYGVKDNALRLPDGTTIRVEKQPYGQVKDKEAFRQWCIANGYENQLQLWPSVMNALVKERLLAGEPEPDGCEAFGKTTVKLVKAGERGEE